ncbi:MAG: DUF3683 domain-containing protein [Thermodesulfobacteriota bacterium]
MTAGNTREIPYNYTSADDARITKFLFDPSVWYAMEKMRFQRKTGRLARLLMRVMGDLFMARRNPFLYQELVADSARRGKFLAELRASIVFIESKSAASIELNTVLERCRTGLEELAGELEKTGVLRQKTIKKLGAVIGEDNVCFDPFSLNSHITDATDWRLHVPFAVARPTMEAQIPPLLTAIAELGLRAIPRGAGTGLTGGAVPVRPGCVMINTEKLNHIHGIEILPNPDENASVREVAVLHAEAGVITGDAMSYADTHGYVFATDPTSAWACTIGGNIAENAGGKTAVLWGTAIDNIWSFRIAVPGGRNWEVRRKNHPLRKILPDDLVVFEVFDGENGNLLHHITLPGTEIRKAGLGKDITNKALGGVPGIQKEGTDGVITSARFILHRAYPFVATACLEFFGDDMDEAARVICDLSNAFVDRGEEALMALEHFDEEYVRAIGYKTKAPRRETPKAVLLVDMVAQEERQLERARTRLSDLLRPYPNTGLFFAADRIEAARYWQDRKKLGAIAARTNAFKLNEDIVLPLPALAEFADFVDRYNIEEERHNQRTLVWTWGTYLETAKPIADPQWLDAKIGKARELLANAIERLTYAGKDHLRQETHIRELKSELLDLFRGYSRVSDEIGKLYTEIRSHLIVIATHMHAGDGNVHVNIPVFSNDREMMARAAETAEIIMAKAVELDGVVSGEHGIGFTKLAHIDPRRLEELAEYRRKIDPEGLMNPGKLSDLAVPALVFTPSFLLLGLEAQILRHASLQELGEHISKCIRCGRCKADCCTFYPSGNLFFHPRNKNLAIGALIEALLYDAQRSHSTRFDFLRYLEEIADHCTICHKCVSPCPVNIDTAEVSILERRLLVEKRFKQSRPLVRMTLAYLESRSKLFNGLFRVGVLRWGSRIQRLGHRLSRLAVGPEGRRRRPLLEFLASPVTAVPRQSMRADLPTCAGNQAVYIRPDGEIRRTVLYFPGCGSERLFSRVGRASLYILLRSGAAVVLPPPFLCCGYPARVNAKTDMEGRVVLRNTIILNQIRDMFGYLSFDACIVSCGTCREALKDQALESIYNAPLVDVAQFVLSEGLTFESRGELYYHRPCHDSLEGAALELLSRHGGGHIREIPHCCSEAGTLALSRPDIAAAMRTRKSRAMRLVLASRRESVTLLTNCPSCLQGLGRHPQLRCVPRHIAEEIAGGIGGETWEKELHQTVKQAEVIAF